MSNVAACPVFLPERGLSGRACGSKGFSMIEVLIALVILLVGLLGLAGLLVQSQRSEMESYQRMQAMILLQDMASRINANRKAAVCYAFTSTATTAATSPYLGTASTLAPAATVPAGALPAGCAVPSLQAAYPSLTPTAAASAVALALNDLNVWHNLLLGSGETAAGVGNVGAMTSARGCITYDPTQELTNLNTGLKMPGTGVYYVSVAWQGLGDTAANTTFLCGRGQYGASDAARRVVSSGVRIANLN